MITKVVSEMFILSHCKNKRVHPEVHILVNERIKGQKSQKKLLLYKILL